MSKQIQKSYSSASQQINVSSKQIQSELCHRCRHPKAPSSDADDKERKESNGVVLSDNIRFLFENFKSLYLEDFHRENVSTQVKHIESLSNTSEAPKTLARLPAPIFSSGEYSPTEANGSTTAALDDFIAVLTYSPSPYRAFQRSMMGLVEVRLGRGEKVDWDFLEELLFRYLNMNNEKAHKYILRAFVDLVIVLHENK